MNIDVLKKGHWKLDEAGIYVEDTPENIISKFSAKKQNDLFEIENCSWWFKYRANVIRKFANKYLNRSEMMLDIGGGNGFMTESLNSDGYKTLLLEPAYEACLNAKKRKIDMIVCGSINDKIEDNSIRQCLLLDVLEHIEIDSVFLECLYKKLLPGGKVLITVPAFPLLWSSEDDDAGHFKRYKIEQLNCLVEKLGFLICYENYYFSFLFFPLLIIRVWCEKLGLLKRKEDRTEEEKRKIMERQFKEPRGIIGVILSLLEKQELYRLLANKKNRFGTSIICILKKS